MSIDQHVAVTIKVNNAGLAKVGFGTIGLLSYTDLFAERSRSYSRLSDVTDDGFAADSPEAVFAQQVFAQSPHPKTLKILRGTLPPTQKYIVAVEAVREEHDYQLNVSGEGVEDTLVEYTSEVGDANDDIVAGLVAALNLVPGKNYTATAIGVGGSQTVQILATAAGDWFTVEPVSVADLNVSQTHADPGIATDLAAILAADRDWYWLATSFNSRPCVLAAAAWVEATAFKAYIPDFVDSDAELDVVGGADVADDVTALGYKRTLPFYHRKPVEMAGAALEGRLAALVPGSWTAAYKTLSGVTADTFTTTQTTNLDAKRTTYYKQEGGRSFTWEGKIGNTDYGFLDVTVSLDFVLDGIQKAAFGVLSGLDKVSYTDEDIEIIRSAIAGFIDLCASDKYKIVARGTPGDPDDPAPSVTFPRVADIDPATRALRELPDGDISFRLQGAVHFVDVTVNVSF